MADITNIQENLEKALTRCHDLRDLYACYEADEYLMGIERQVNFFLDIIEEMDIFIYGYFKYVYEAGEIEEEKDTKIKEGRVKAIEYLHFKIDFEELFEGYPDEERIAERYRKEFAVDEPKVL